MQADLLADTIHEVVNRERRQPGRGGRAHVAR
jgi:hypothetical protein